MLCFTVLWQSHLSSFSLAAHGCKEPSKPSTPLHASPCKHLPHLAHIHVLNTKVRSQSPAAGADGTVPAAECALLAHCLLQPPRHPRTFRAQVMNSTWAFAKLSCADAELMALDSTANCSTPMSVCSTAHTLRDPLSPFLAQVPACATQPGDYSMSAIYENLRQLITVVDELRDVGLQHYISLPRIAAIGTQSSGTLSNDREMSDSSDPVNVDEPRFVVAFLSVVFQYVVHEKVRTVCV